jgi:hypothetical protein
MSDTKRKDTVVVAVESAPDVQVVETQPVRVWAEKAGHLPEALPGTRLKPARFNRKSWLARAACARLGLTLDALTDEGTYLDAVAAVLAVGAR